MFKKAICLTFLFVLMTQFRHAEAATVCLPATFTGGTILEDSAFCAFASPYTLHDNVYVPHDVTLYVEQGVTVRWFTIHSLTVDGSFQATGTAAEPIVFTSARGIPEAGDWLGIRFREDSDANEMINMTVEYAGFNNQPAVLVETDDLSFRNSMVRNNLNDAVEISRSAPFLWQLDLIDNGGAAVVMKWESAPDWFHLDTSGNGYDGVRMSGGTSADLALGDNGISNYQLVNDFSINPGHTLTVHPGTTLGFKDSGGCGNGKLNVHGTLSAVGTTSRRINITGQQIGCRAAGEWEGVHFHPTSHNNVLEYVNMFEGGGGVSPMIQVETSGLTIRYSSLSSSVNAAMRVASGSPTISHSNIFNNGGGITNTGVGTVRAECVYWGDASGANSADNPAGTGQSVTGSVDTSPHRTQFFLIEDTNCATTPTAVSLADLTTTNSAILPVIFVALLLLVSVTASITNSRRQPC